jgi:hypothetical protein
VGRLLFPAALQRWLLQLYRALPDFLLYDLLKVLPIGIRLVCVALEISNALVALFHHFQGLV